MNSYLYDIECLPNFFSVIFIKINTKQEYINAYIKADIENDLIAKKEALIKIKHREFIIFNDINQVAILKSFVINNCNTLIAYNNFKYDNLIIDYITTELNIHKSATLIATELYNLSQDIISYQDIGNYRKDNDLDYSGHYNSIDLMKLHYLDKRKISLKQVSIALKWYRVEEYTPLPITDAEVKEFNYNTYDIAWYNRYVILAHIPHVIDYNINDVLITYRLYHHGIDELKQRLNISRQYDINVISESRSGSADRLMSKFYQDTTGLKYWDFYQSRTYRKKINFKDIIEPSINFKTNELSSFLVYLKSIIIKVDTDKFEETLIFKGTKYKFAKGGLHSIDIGKEYNKTDSTIVQDADITSFYPAIITNYKIKPKHLLSAFNDILEHLMNQRIASKREGDKDTADILKIVINSVYGKLGFMYSWMYDLKAMYKVTINGQLLLLMLIEELEEIDGVHVVSANTDGIVCTIKNNVYDAYMNICNKWSDYTGFNLEYTEYKKYVRTTVNDYITVKTDGSSKTKGDFVSKINIDKGYYAPVIAKTLYEYYVNDNHDIDSVIKTFDIYEYCISQKVGSQFKTEFHTIKDSNLNIDILQKSNRYFVSNSGGVLLKRNVETDKTTNIVKGKYVTIFNKYFNSDDYNIDYRWYKSKVMNIINKVNNEITKDKKKTIGTMFDNLDE